MLLPVKRQLLSSPPAWVLRGASGLVADFDFWFERGLFWQKGIGAASGLFSPAQAQRYLTTVRASSGYIDNLNGVYTTIGNNLPRMSDKGILSVEARTNLALWCRDFTNAAWVKVNTTAALTATGIDNAANSASTLTATSGLATALQTITQASTADTVSFFIKRRTGTGTIEVTGDGVAYTDITSSLSTTSWYRASISATLVNPVIGVRITTNGDAIDVDFAQLEAGTWATSPILTTTASALRASDVITLTRPLIYQNNITQFVDGTPHAPAAYGTNQIPLAIDDGSTSNRIWLARAASTGVASTIDTPTGAGGSAVWVQNAAGKEAQAFQIGSQAMAFNGIIQGTNTTNSFASGLSAVHIGSNVFGLSQFNGYLRRCAMWASARLSNSDLVRITS